MQVGNKEDLQCRQQQRVTEMWQHMRCKGQAWIRMGERGLSWAGMVGRGQLQRQQGGTAMPP